MLKADKPGVIRAARSYALRRTWKDATGQFLSLLPENNAEERENLRTRASKLSRNLWKAYVRNPLKHQ